MKNTYIYRYIDKNDGKIKYIGITKNINQRIEVDHKIDKLGKSRIDWNIEILGKTDRWTAELAEAFYINYYGTGDFFNDAKVDNNVEGINFFDREAFEKAHGGWEKYKKQERLKKQGRPIISIEKLEKKIKEAKENVDKNNKSNRILKYIYEKVDKREFIEAEKQWFRGDKSPEWRVDVINEADETLVSAVSSHKSMNLNIGLIGEETEEKKIKLLYYSIPVNFFQVYREALSEYYEIIDEAEKELIEAEERLKEYERISSASGKLSSSIGS